MLLRITEVNTEVSELVFGIKMSSANRVGAYGAGWATGNFEPLVYFRKPEVILRLVAWVRSVSVSVRNGSDPSALGVCRVTSW